MRRLTALVSAIALAVSFAFLDGTSAAAAEPDFSKMSPAIADLYTVGDYGDFPIAEVVVGHQPGDLYYLAKVTGEMDAALAQSLADAGARTRFVFPEIDYVALVSTAEGVANVSNLDRVTRLEIDRVHDIQNLTTQVLTASDFADQTRRGTGDMGADVVWAEGITGAGVLVGVTDSGVDSTHPDLGYKLEGFVDCTAVLPSIIVGFNDVGTCHETAGYDDNGHGTHVSGIAVGGARGVLPSHSGLLPGVAPDADLAGAKVCLAVGSCLNSSVMAGLRYLATDVSEGGAGADVVNVSLGSGRFYFAPLFGAEQVTNNDPEAQLVNQLAVDHNVLFTISAGNSGPVLQSLGSPSVASQVLSVGAGITQFDLDNPTKDTQHGSFGDIRPEAAAAGATAIAQFSSRGPSGDRLIKPDLAAPGSYYIAAESAEGAQVSAADIAHNHHFSLDPTYAVLSGTSMSAPAAAGAAALVWDGYEQFTGTEPDYFRVKAALVNTAGGHAFEGSVVGLISGIRAKTLGEDPETAFPLRNEDWVGVSGEGTGRIHVPSALLALTQGVTVYTPQVGGLDDIHELQPGWALDAVAAGESKAQTFLLHGSPALPRNARAQFSMATTEQPDGVHEAPASWFKLPKQAFTRAGEESPFTLGIEVPADAAPGMYGGVIEASVKIGAQTTQTVRIPVQFFVPLPVAEGGSVEGPIWASESTDYSIIGFQNPLGDIFTDWAMFPIRVAEGTGQIDLSVYDTAGTDHMDIFVFDDNGQEVDSSVTPFLSHSVPGDALYTPSTEENPTRVSILDGNDLGTVVPPTTVWVAISDSQPNGVGYSTFHLDFSAAGGGGGTTPSERIHSGSHAWWSGSVGDADSHLTTTVALPANVSNLHFWTWYNIEDGFDWAYVLVSEDDGASWTSLATTAANGSGTTTLDPIGDSGGVAGGNKQYPNGFTGVSGFPPFTGQGLFAPIYVEQTADISAYAGKTIQLRFAYTSDPAVNLENFYVDDVRVLDSTGAVVFSDDMETQDSWTPSGSPGFAWVTAAE